MRTHHAVADMQPATSATSQRDGARTSVTPLEFTEPRQHTPSLSLSNTPRCTTSAVADGSAKREVRNRTSSSREWIAGLYLGRGRPGPREVDGALLSCTKHRNRIASEAASAAAVGRRRCTRRCGKGEPRPLRPHAARNTGTYLRDKGTYLRNKVTYLRNNGMYCLRDRVSFEDY